MPEEYQKISASVSDPKSENLQKLAALFPSVVKDGQVDFDALKAELGEFTEVGKEFYSLNWAGKQEAQKKTGEPILGRTLKFIPDESKNADTTENLYIEGDNLEALKLLQNSYRGRVKMIYIDPPYNTGNDFVYNDSFSQTQKETDAAEGRISEEGERLQVNPKTSAKYHANWLSMMYPRLRLAKNLLSEDGVIFISIDDNEVANLREICDEIFGSGNFVSQLGWQKVYSPKNQSKLFSNDYEFVLCYSKNLTSFSLGDLPRTEDMNARYKNPDDDPRGPWQSGDLVASGERKNGHYIVTSPKTGKTFDVPQGKHWVFAQENLYQLVNDGQIWFGTDGNSFPRKKQYLSEVGGRRPSSLLHYSEYGHTDQAKKELMRLFSEFERAPFDTPKPVKLIKMLSILGTKENDIVLDFFAGSGTTAHSLLELNSESNSNRKFILIQLQEMVENNPEIRKLGLNTISDVCKERIRRAGEKIKSEHPDAKIDTGFKVFRVEDTNIRWIAAEKGTQGVTLEDALTASSKDLRDFMKGANDLDVVYEILIRQYDIPLTASIVNLPQIGKRTYSIADTVVVCLEEEISGEIIDKIAAIEPIPQKIIFRDSAFDDDISMKENAMMRLDALMQKHASGGKQPYSVEFL